MLYDLYLLSCYFSPDQAVMYEDEVIRRYDATTVREVIRQGWVSLHGVSGLVSSGGFFRITALGIKAVENKAH